MLSTFWTAPADLCGRGGTAMRPSLLGAVPVAQGIGLPVAGMAPRFRTNDVITQNDSAQNDSTQNDSTTLGNHSPGRPRS